MALACRYEVNGRADDISASSQDLYNIFNSYRKFFFTAKSTDDQFVSFCDGLRYLMDVTRITSCWYKEHGFTGKLRLRSSVPTWEEIYIDPSRRHLPCDKLFEFEKDIANVFINGRMSGKRFMPLFERVDVLLVGDLPMRQWFNMHLEHAKDVENHGLELLK